MPDLSGLNHLRTFALVSPDHPVLGIDAESVEGDFGHFFGAPDGEGVLVRSVFGDSPAAKAGIKVGDVITSLDGERIRSASELREKLLTKRDKKEIKLGLLRNKAELTLSVELPQQKDEEEHFFSTARTSDFHADKNARLTQMVSRASLFQAHFSSCPAGSCD